MDNLYLTFVLVFMYESTFSICRVREANLSVLPLGARNSAPRIHRLLVKTADSETLAM